jgi:HEAT repeat protein
VVPEATPNPRTIRFRTGAIHGGPSRWYESESAAKAADDPGVRRLFGDFQEVANLLVGPDFVAISLRRGTDWERLLAPVLQAVTEEFAPNDAAAVDEASEESEERVVGGPAGSGAAGAEARTASRRPSRLEQAWVELGTLRPADREDLVMLQEAVRGADPFRRQVAANLLREADEDAAAAEWARLVRDPSRSVRRAAVDAIVDVGRESLRPLLETALGDTDPWVRWKAIRGLVELGPAPSRDAIAACTDDTDFRVRLEVAAALRVSGTEQLSP